MNAIMGLLIEVLNKRYGKPKIDFIESEWRYTWNDANELLRCILYSERASDSARRGGFGDLEDVYGVARGGALLGGSLKVSTISGESVYGLYRIEILQEQPEILKAKGLDPQVCFFMDAANIWFYGVKEQHLYVYDSATDELDLLGPLDSEIEATIAQWEAAKGEECQ